MSHALSHALPSTVAAPAALPSPLPGPIALPSEPLARAQAILFGPDPTPHLVGLGNAGNGGMTLYFRDPATPDSPEKVRSQVVPWRPFLFITDDSLLMGCPEPYRIERLTGPGELKFLVHTPNSALQFEVLRFLRNRTGLSLSDPNCPYYTVNDDQQLFLMGSGRTLFRDMAFEDVHRLQLDLETDYDSRYEFPNSARASDRIIVISMSDNRGWECTLCAPELSEDEMLRTFVRIIQERDPDIIEGHNLFRFDLPYLETRAARYQIPLLLGRDGSPMRSGDSRQCIGEREMPFIRQTIFGRHVVDTMMLAQLYDHDFHTLDSFSLKDLARHFGGVPADRTYISGGDIRQIYRDDPERLRRYALDDVRETRSVADVLLRPYFVETQRVPLPLQSVISRSYVLKIESIFARTYLHQRTALPFCPTTTAPPLDSAMDHRFGIFGPVLSLDTRALPARLMLSRGDFPSRDTLRLYYPILTYCAHQQEVQPQEATPQPPDSKRAEVPAHAQVRTQEAWWRIQRAVFEYLRYQPGHCADPTLAGIVQSATRDLMRRVRKQLETAGARTICGVHGGLILEAPRTCLSTPDAERLLGEVNAQLPSRVKIELEGYYCRILHLKAFNYALLRESHTVHIEGTLLRSKIVEPCLRRFSETLLQRVLELKWESLPELVFTYQAGIQRDFSLQEFLRRETLRDSLATYQAAQGQRSRTPLPGHEAALRAKRSYQIGDQLSWYVGIVSDSKVSDSKVPDATTPGISSDQEVPEHIASRLGILYDPNTPDLNRAYYLKKLEEIYRRIEAPIMKIGGPSWDKVRRLAGEYATKNGIEEVG